MLDENAFEQIAAALRDTIERQIATTPEGKMFAAQNPGALAKLVTNIVGNATYTVSNLIEDALAASKG